jgi:hypothetical protein
MKYFVISICLTLVACKKEVEKPREPINILNSTIGDSKVGTANHFIKNPYFVWRQSKVHVNVSKGNADSTINLSVFYDDTLSIVHHNIRLDADLKYSENFGSSPNDGLLSIEIGQAKDIYYMYFLPCSDGCVYGTDFTLSF